MKTIFIAGTDTNIGKTFVSSILLREFNALGLKTFALKPIASGCQQNDDGNLRSDDALCLQTHSSINQPYSVVNPIALKEPIAPHLAARKMGIDLSKAIVKKYILNSIQREADINVIEGVGGWSVPLNDYELFSDVICELNIPVILVVGIKLGCLNHALLTYKNITVTKAPFIGWIANCIAPDTLSIEENIHTLRKWIIEPLLGTVTHNCHSLEHINTHAILNFLFQQGGIS